MGDTIDVERARTAFEESTDLTVGLEEEFALLDPETLGLVDRYEELCEAAGREDPALHEGITGELIASELEIVSGRGESFHAALAAQRDRRARLFALADRRGVALGATGTHPWADYREQVIIDTPHYQRLRERLRWVAQRNNTWSLHVHVGVRGADRALRVCDRLRGVLPLLLAVSANSPFLDGRDAGLHSARTQAFTKSFPRCGVPDPFGSFDAWADYVELLVRTGSIDEWTQLWWSVRPHPSFGTVEVRICDAQSTPGESEALAGLVVACVAQAARDEDEGVPWSDPAPRLIEENLWRALRHGLDGRLVDFDRGEEFAAPDAVERLGRWTAPVRAELGLDVTVPEANGAQRQRRALQRGASMQEVYAASVRETREYARQEVVAP